MKDLRASFLALWAVSCWTAVCYAIVAGIFTDWHHWSTLTMTLVFSGSTGVAFLLGRYGKH